MDITDPNPDPKTLAERRRLAAAAGHESDEPAARALLGDPHPTVRATALAALVRMGRSGGPDFAAAVADVHPAVRRRAAVEAVGAVVDLVPLLGDPEPLVAEAAAWALGERAAGAGSRAVSALARMATQHPDALCREAAVAALGAIGDAGGLAAILAATADKAPVRRRAVLALAPFDGPEVEAALQRARTDRDWQVRQAAEDLAP